MCAAQGTAKQEAAMGHGTRALLSANHNGRDEGEVARIRADHPDEPECVLNDRVLGGIAVTRAIGDQVFKLPLIWTQRVFDVADPNAYLFTRLHGMLQRNLTPPYVSNIPEVRHVDLSHTAPEDTVLILASDGLADLYEAEYELEDVAKRWVHTATSCTNGKPATQLLRAGMGGGDVEKASWYLTVEMDQPWLDDVTVIVDSVELCNFLLTAHSLLLSLILTSTTLTTAHILRTSQDIDIFIMSLVAEQVEYTNTHGLFTCLSCTIAFLSAADQREHYRSDHHRYNMKRRVAGLPPVSAETFNSKVLERKAETAIMASSKGSICEVCGKTYTTENAYRSHINSKKHKENELKASEKLARKLSTSEPTEDVVESTPEAATSRLTEITVTEEVTEKLAAVTLTVDADASEAEVNQTIDEKIAAARSRLQPTQCLFCPEPSSTLEANLAHMSVTHSFFIPDTEYLIDVSGLITYLGEKIAVGNVCIYCNGKGREFRTLDAVRKHMVDKGHCKIAYETEKDRLELSDFYDFSASYPDAAKSKKTRRRVVIEEDDDEWEDEDGDEEEDVDEVVDVVSDEESEGDLPDNQVTYGDTPYELVLPSGARIGHRSLRRYYAQSFHFRSDKPQDPNSGAAIVRRLLADKNTDLVPRKGGFGAYGTGTEVIKARNRGEAREAGRHVREHRDQRRREEFKTRVGFIHNHQKHYRDPLLQ
ncbi:hypothetical protein NM688_g5376 [Phlebia brevispora]|uniref:Uncharacterized protein n=1 Tax=Phlebia brevispora TaxID=194682 RepID=A0ACC1SWA3_9APHY|nr:hypothetical protein NM688_g5376 [Phlebia brevispora]